MLAAQQITKEATHLQSLNKKLQMPEKSTSMDQRVSFCTFSFMSVIYYHQNMVIKCSPSMI